MDAHKLKGFQITILIFVFLSPGYAHGQKFLFKTFIVIPKEGPQFELSIDSLVEENARVNFHIEHGEEYYLRSEDFFIIAWGYDEGELNFSFTDTSGNYSTRTLTGELRFSVDFSQ